MYFTGAIVMNLPFFPRLFLGILSAGAVMAVPQARADVKMPAIFGDHMVLQRDGSVPFWGWAEPGETVTVSAGGDQATATADKDGKWEAKLSNLKASSTPIEVTVKGKNQLTFTDVLVGDVWVCSGQSNMEFGIKAFMKPEELEKAGDPQIRLFSVPKWVAPKPGQDIAPAPANMPGLGKWVVCTPQTLVSSGEWSGFPAVGFYFGQQIHAFTHQPVGLIGSCWGGTRINSWTSLETLQAVPSMAGYLAGAVKFRDHYDEIKTEYESQTLPAWNAELAKWKEDNKDKLAAYQTAMEQWRKDANAAAAGHQAAPPRPVAPKEPRAPRDTVNDNQTSAALFNGMIAPIIPYGIKGVIWYQGESNGDQPGFYRIALPALIKDWRTHWDQGDFPFMVVQLPNFQARKPEPSESTWAGVREAEALAAATVPKTGMAVTIDLGEAGNIHPADKYDVGQRLALAAQRVAYGDDKTVTSGPTLQKATVQGNAIRVTFDNVGGGLTMGTAPEHFYLAQRPPAKPPIPTEIEGFAVAGADQKYYWAKATIDGDSVVVTSDKVLNPVTVRYAWADNPAANLYNKEGLPAAPFRTDTTPFTK